MAFASWLTEAWDRRRPATSALAPRAARSWRFSIPTISGIRTSCALQMRCLRDDPGLDFCVTHVQMFWEPAVADEGKRLKGHARATEPVPGFSTTTLLVRRTAFDRVGPFDPGLWFADAVDWFMRAETAGLRHRLLPDVLTYHRMHESNLTRRRDRDSRAEFLRVVKAWADRRPPTKTASRGDDQPRPLEELPGDVGPEGARAHPPPARRAETGTQALVGDQT